MNLIRLTRICWFCRILDHSVQRISQLLCKDGIQPQSGANSNFRSLVSVNDGLSQGQIEYSSDQSGFSQYRRHASGGGIGVSNVDLPPVEHGLLFWDWWRGNGAGHGNSSNQFSKNQVVVSSGAFAPNLNLETLNSKQHVSQWVNLLKWGEPND